MMTDWKKSIWLDFNRVKKYHSMIDCCSFIDQLHWQNNRDFPLINREKKHTFENQGEEGSNLIFNYHFLLGKTLTERNLFLFIIIDHRDILHRKKNVSRISMSPSHSLVMITIACVSFIYLDIDWWSAFRHHVYMTTR